MIVATHMEAINSNRPCGTPCWEDAFMENFISLKIFVCLFMDGMEEDRKQEGIIKTKDFA